MGKQLIAMLLLAFGVGPAVAQTHGPQQPMQQAPAVDWRLELLDTAVRKGKAEDRISGNFVNEFNRIFDTNGSITVKARVLKSLPEKGCKRIEVSYLKAGAWMPTGRSDATFKHLIDHCVTVGKAPAKAASAARKRNIATQTQQIVSEQGVSVVHSQSQRYSRTATYDFMSDPHLAADVARHNKLSPVRFALKSDGERFALTKAYLEETDHMRRMMMPTQGFSGERLPSGAGELQRMTEQRQDRMGADLSQVHAGNVSQTGHQNPEALEHRPTSR